MSSSIVQKFKNVGPGALVAAGFIGPGTVTTCTVSGASYGYTMLWALLFATVATIIFQEMASRVGIVSGKGLGENIRDRIPNKALMWIAIVIVLIAIFVGNIAYETGNITGGILGIQAVLPDVPMIPIVIVLGVLAFIAMWIGSYKVVEVILTAIVVFMGVVFFVTAIASSPDWGAIATGLFVPTLPEEGSKGILTAVGLIGTTIVPYNLFLHASGASERFKDPEQVSDARFDTVLSIGLGGIISMAILICAAANIYGTELGDQLRSQLKPLGIDLKVNVVEFSTWLQDVYTNHTFDISLVDHNESHDFASWTDPTYYFGYDNKNVTKLYNEGVAATSDKERDAKFAAAAKLVSEDAPADWLFNYRITTATAKGVEGFPFDLNQTVLPLYNVTYTK